MASKHIVIPILFLTKDVLLTVYIAIKIYKRSKDDMTEEKMISIIESHIDSACEDTYIEIGFYGGSFTGIEREEQYRYLETANRYIKEGKVKSIRLSTRPDYINEEILDYLENIP